MRIVFVMSALVAAAVALVTPAASAPVDPRSGGLEIVMGEWTLVAESKAIRPGRVTFVVTNRGRFGHGFRIRARRGAGEDGAARDRFEARTRVLAPGQTARLTVTLSPGTYDIECYVEDVHGDHEARGMHALLRVRANAPFVQPKPKRAANTVRIAGFKYAPSPVRVPSGTTVRWVNEDTAKHTVSARNGAFSSRELTKGQTYSRKFVRRGSYVYLCALHPQMQGTVVVR
jgi:plastocyanin